MIENILKTEDSIVGTLTDLLKLTSSASAVGQMISMAPSTIARKIKENKTDNIIILRLDGQLIAVARLDSLGRNAHKNKDD